MKKERKHSIIFLIILISFMIIPNQAEAYSFWDYAKEMITPGFAADYYEESLGFKCTEYSDSDYGRTKCSDKKEDYKKVACGSVPNAYSVCYLPSSKIESTTSLTSPESTSIKPVSSGGTVQTYIYGEICLTDNDCKDGNLCSKGICQDQYYYNDDGEAVKADESNIKPVSSDSNTIINKYITTNVQEPDQTGLRYNEYMDLLNKTKYACYIINEQGDKKIYYASGYWDCFFYKQEFDKTECRIPYVKDYTDGKIDDIKSSVGLQANNKVADIEYTNTWAGCKIKQAQSYIKMFFNWLLPRILGIILFFGALLIGLFLLELFLMTTGIGVPFAKMIKNIRKTMIRVITFGRIK